jgi:hypothetical protein
VIVYNSLASTRSTNVRLPVASDTPFQITRVDETAQLDKVQIVYPVEVSRLRATVESKFAVTFNCELPPAGAAAFRVVKANTSQSKASQPNASVQQRRLGEVVHISNGLLTATFNQSTGLLTQVQSNGVTLPFEQSWGYYKSFDSEFDHSDVPFQTPTQNSGAYIFRPSLPDEQLTVVHPSSHKAVFVSISCGVEIHSFFEEPWIHQVARIMTGEPYVEIEYTIGPIPIDDGRGKEVMARYAAPIKSHGRFYTDSNGREFQERRKNYRPSWKLDTYEPVAGNFYPVNAAIYLEDGSSAFSIVVDRSQAGSSLTDGSIELMVQRRTIVDDGRGVDEPLNETTGGMTAYPPFGDAHRVGDGVVIRGKHRIMVGGAKSGASMSRSIMDGVFCEPLVFVGSSKAGTPIIFKRSTFSVLREGLAANVKLISFKKLPSVTKTPTMLVRLGHQYARNENSTYSQPVNVDLSALFPNATIVSVVEKTLTGNQNWKDYLDRRLNWTGTPSQRERIDPLKPVVTLQPMDIRTFYVELADQ